MTTTLKELRRRKASSAKWPNRDAIRVRTAEIRCGWDRDEYRRRRNEARHRQEELLKLAAPETPVHDAPSPAANARATARLASFGGRYGPDENAADENPYVHNVELLAILGIFSAGA